MCVQCNQTRGVRGHTIVQRQGTDDQGGAIQILGIPASGTEHNSLVFSVLCFLADK